MHKKMNHPVGLLVMHGIGNQSPGSVAAPLASLFADADTQPYQVQDLCWSVSSNDQTLLIVEGNWSRTSSPDNLPEIRLGTHIFPQMLNGVAQGYRTCFGLNRYLSSSSVSWKWVLLIHVWFVFLAAAFYFGKEEGEQVATIALMLGASVLFPICFRLEGLSRLNQWWTMPFRVALALLISPVVALFLFTLVIYLPTTVVFSGFVFIPTLVAWPIVQIIKALSKMGAFGRMKVWVHRIVWLALIGPVQGFAQAAMGISNMWSYVCSGPGSIVNRYLIYFIQIIIMSLAPIFVGAWLLAITSPFIYTADLFSDNLDVLSSVLWLLPLGLALVIAKFALPLVDLLLDVSRYHLASLEERKRYTKYAQDGIMRLRSLGCTEIHILAHSLGTVIVYDWLRSSPPEKRKDVVSLITIGSPLNKFWYIDHGYQERVQDLEGSVVAGLTWHNFYAWSDPVSSRLRKYGTEVIEQRLRWLGVWGLAHTNYWKNDEVANTVRRHLAKSSD